MFSIMVIQEISVEFWFKMENCILNKVCTYLGKIKKKIVIIKKFSRKKKTKKIKRNWKYQPFTTGEDSQLRKTNLIQGVPGEVLNVLNLDSTYQNKKKSSS